MNISRMFAGLNISSAGLSAQRKRMNAIAENLANAETTKTAQGGPYQRRFVELKAKGERVFSAALRQAGLNLATTNASHMDALRVPEEGGDRVDETVTATDARDQSPPRLVYDPGNPDANADGYVAMPNVNIVTEMVGMMTASREFEANVVAVDASKNIAKDSLDI